MLWLCDPRRLLVVLLVAAGAVASIAMPAAAAHHSAATIGAAVQGVSLAENGDNEDVTSAEGPSVTFGVQPAQAGGRDSRPSFSWGVTPGGTIRDHVAVLNYSRAPLRLSVYATDALNTEDGGFGLLPGADDPADAGSWMHLAGIDGEVKVPARRGNALGEVVVPIKVAVPVNASPGDHTAGIVAVLTTLDPNNDGTKVELEQRIGTRVFVRVAGEANASLSIDNLEATYHGTLNPVGRGSTTVTYTLTNNGNINLGANSVVSANGLLTDASVPAPDVPLLLVGNSVDVSVEVPEVLPQVWMGAQVDITPVHVGADTGQPPAVISRSVQFWAIPWVLLALMLGLILAIAYRRWRRRARRRVTGSHRAGSPIPHGAEAGLPVDTRLPLKKGVPS